MGRINLVSGPLGHAVLADQGDREPAGVVDVVKPIAPLDAEPPAVGRSVAALDEEDTIVLEVKAELAADAAVRAKAVDLAVALVRGRASLVEDRGGQKRPRRTGLDALAAAHAATLSHRV